MIMHHPKLNFAFLIPDGENTTKINKTSQVKSEKSA